MANHYLQFSEVLPHLTGDEERWLRQQLEVVSLFGDQEYVKDSVPAGLDPAEAAWTGCRAYQDLDGYEPDFGEEAGFSYRFSDDPHGEWGRHLWLYTDESGDLERLAHLVQKFLRAFRPHQCWSLTYATTCSKPRVGEFGGGALFVTADNIRWHNADEFIQQERAAVAGAKMGSAPQIVLNMAGGLIQDVYSSDPAITVTVVDWDIDGCDPTDDRIVRITDRQGRTQFAAVTSPHVCSLSELAGSDTAAALQAASAETAVREIPHD